MNPDLYTDPYVTLSVPLEAARQDLEVKLKEGFVKAGHLEATNKELLQNKRNRGDVC